MAVVTASHHSDKVAAGPLHHVLQTSDQHRGLLILHLADYRPFQPRPETAYAPAAIRATLAGQCSSASCWKADSSGGKPVSKEIMGRGTEKNNPCAHG